MGAPSKKAKAALTSAIESVAAEIGAHCVRPGSDFTRDRKCGAAQILTLLVTMGSDTMGRECRSFFGRAGADPPGASAVPRQRAKMLPSATREVLVRFSSQLCGGAPPWRGRYRVVAVDGTELPTQRGSDPATANKGKDGALGYNSMYATCAYDLAAGAFVDAVVVPGPQKDEHAAFRLMVDRREGPRETVWLADRGFASYNDFAHVVESGASFVVRVKDAQARSILGLRRDAPLPDGLDEEARLIITRSRGAAGRSRPGRAADYRPISRRMKLDYITDGEPEYDLALRVVRLRLGDGTFENIATNLGAGEAGADDLRELYGMRWGIETAFRHLKHTVGAAHLHSGRPQLAEQEIFARMTLYDFCMAVVAAVAAAGPPRRGRVHERRVDVTNAVKDCVRWLGGAGPPEGPEGLMGGRLQPIRPGRSFDRHRRLRSPESFGYRSA